MDKLIEIVNYFAKKEIVEHHQPQPQLLLQPQPQLQLQHLLHLIVQNLIIVVDKENVNQVILVHVILVTLEQIADFKFNTMLIVQKSIIVISEVIV